MLNYWQSIEHEYTSECVACCTATWNAGSKRMQLEFWIHTQTGADVPWCFNLSSSLACTPTIRLPLIEIAMLRIQVISKMAMLFEVIVYHPKWRVSELLMIKLCGERVTIARRCDWRFTQAPSGIWIWNLNILCFDFDVGCQTLDYNFGGLILGCIEADFYKWLIFALQKPDVYFRSWQ